MLTREFFRWMEDRETIRLKRLAGDPPPWTSDPILSTFRFCNVLREYDKVSIWIANHIVTPGINCGDLWISLALARQVNHIPSMEEILLAGLFPRTRWSRRALTDVRSLLDARQRRGEQVFTSAYMIHADSSPATSDLWFTKAHYVVEMVVGQLLGKNPPLASIEAFVKWMTQYESWGGFMSYEVACDLRWAPGWLDTAPDIRTWANPGPGARRGLNRIWERDLKAPITTAQCIDEMRTLLQLAYDYSFRIDWPRPLEMRDIEHSLCEFDKYRRVLEGQGKPRQKYSPR